MALSSSDESALGAQVRELGDRLLASVHGRIELISIELQEEKFRLIQTFVWISSAVFIAMLAITFASIALVFAFDESLRLTVLGCLAALYFTAFLATVIAFRSYLGRQPRPFADTLEEIEKDRACIPNGN
jgi:uncharacterized membrane protein YqjE